MPVFVNGHGFLVRLEGEVIKKLSTSAPGSIPVQKNTSIESNIDNNELLLKLQATEVSNLYVIRKQKVLFQIIDKNGALKLEQSEKSSFRTENLKIAQEMAAKGEDENSIRFATGWKKKANQGNHPFEILDIQGLAGAVQKPVAVFEYGDKRKSQNVIVNLEKDGKNFLVGVFFNQIRDGFEVSSIRGLFNRDNMDWMHWIQQGKMIYGNKEKIQVLAEQQRTNLADVHSKEARTSSDSYYLDSVDNILQSFGDVKDIYTKDFPRMK